MNKRQFFFAGVLLAAATGLLSWGVTGHRTIGKIAENHLSPRAKAGVESLLGNETLADVAPWADEVRNQPEYRATAPWHFLDLPLGLSYPEFEKTVEGMTRENIYSALLQQEKVIADPGASREKKADALKFVVHFVGDMHQPMHVSREEDKGGNTIQVNYEGKGTNLHSLWDTRLLEHQGMTYEQLAEKYDHATPSEIKKWQSDPLIKWLWESYEISTRLYAEIDAMKSRSIDDSYYQAHIGIIQLRIEQAGIRLAGVLNELFKNGPVTGPAAGAPAGAGKTAAAEATPVAATMIDINDAAKHIDENVTICAKVYGYKALDGMTLVNVGAAYPNQLLTVVLRGSAKDGGPGIDGQTVCVSGKVILYKEKPEIIVTDRKQIVVKAKQ
ncbi:MAG TPA: S1/P1 nuclease [Puia sp.]|jgi:hypothetical protein